MEFLKKIIMLKSVNVVCVVTTAANIHLTL